MKIELLSKLRGNNRLETAENYSILAIVVGLIMFSVGVLLTIVATRGFSTILAMLGAVISFISTISLIDVWVMKESEK